MTIDGTVEIITQYASIFSTGDIIAVFVSIISLLGVIISTTVTNLTTKKISESNEKSQEKLNQKNIEANLIAKARIEWIQKVRNTTAELLALYFKVINTVDKEHLLEYVIKAQEKTELLILYFGHEEQNGMDQPVDLHFHKNNINKNNSIVEFLSILSNKIYRYYESVKLDEFNKLEDIRNRRFDEMQNHVLDLEVEEYEDECGNVGMHHIPILDEACEDSLNEIDERINNVVAISKSIKNDVSNLRDIIRIYLKIEWNKAKKCE
ncbi:hypothetical protein [Proteocatella sphenisci]|uniref:hypothetical protein n=1 Tax=Proteocatella sphenisci TaxID=181070 RepID=UPI0004920DD3|nr:hypothetical protein [Proteocatella sphenisci]